MAFVSFVASPASVPVVHEPAAVWSEEQAIAQPPQVQSPHQALLPEASLDTQKLYAKVWLRICALMGSFALAVARCLTSNMSLSACCTGRGTHESKFCVQDGDPHAGLSLQMQAMQERLLALDSRVSTALDMARKLSESVALLQYALAAVVVVLAITGLLFDLSLESCARK